jgi:polyphosphate glucokinase
MEAGTRGRAREFMRVLVIDIGGNSVKALVAGETEPRKFPSGPHLTPRQMVSAVLKLTEDWHYDAVSIGFPGRVRDNHVAAEPVNLGPGWVHYDFAKAFGRPVKMINDAAMQALGSYRTGNMLFLGLKGLKRLGITKWRDCVHQVVVRFISALELDDVVIGGGNVTKLDKLPPRCRAGDNALAFRGGFLLWDMDNRRKSGARVTASSPSPSSSSRRKN